MSNCIEQKLCCPAGMTTPGVAVNTTSFGKIPPGLFVLQALTGQFEVMFPT
jgi:hypothetical protein